jgi:hypothetical protein
MAFRNKDLVDRRFTNIKGLVRKLDQLVKRGGSIDDFIKSIKLLEEKIEDLESLIEQEASELRNG